MRLCNKEVNQLMINSAISQTYLLKFKNTYY